MVSRAHRRGAAQDSGLREQRYHAEPGGRRIEYAHAWPHRTVGRRGLGRSFREPASPEAHSRTRQAAMIDLFIKGTNELLGSITETELQYLEDSLEETSDEDRDYFVDQATIDLLADGRATDH